MLPLTSQPAGRAFAIVGSELQRLLGLDGGEQFHVEVPLADHQVVAWPNMDGDPVDGAVQVAPPSDEVGATGTGDVCTAQELTAEHGGHMPNESGNPADEYVVFVLDEPLTVFGMKEGDANSLIVTGLSMGAITAEGRDYDAGFVHYEHFDGLEVFSPIRHVMDAGSAQHEQREELDWIDTYFVCGSLLTQLC